ncbi:MAG: hypothetical protein UU59_C0030G0001, partial [candidate division WWE3 bacterium GW2011_GWE1_41_27]
YKVYLQDLSYLNVNTCCITCQQMNVVAIVIPICLKMREFYFSEEKNTRKGNRGKALTIREKRHG